MKKIAVAHQLHHAEKYGGAPWGMFLGPLVSQGHPGCGVCVTPRVWSFVKTGGEKLSRADQCCFGCVGCVPQLTMLRLGVHIGGPASGNPYTCNSRLPLQELESIPGAKEELERRAAELDWSKR